jgi:hypothetical protein
VRTAAAVLLQAGELFGLRYLPGMSLHLAGRRFSAALNV